MGRGGGVVTSLALHERGAIWKKYIFIVLERPHVGREKGEVNLLQALQVKRLPRLVIGAVQRLVRELGSTRGFPHLLGKVHVIVCVCVRACVCV